MNFITNSLKVDLMLNLLLTDTDSLVFQIKTEDVYEDFYQKKNLFIH